MRLLALVLVVASLSSCFVADVGDDPVLACARNSDCPAPLSCNAFTARCVTADDLTAPVPALAGDVVLEPARGDYATTFRVSFDLDGDVADDPSVVVGINEREVRWLIDEAQTARDERHYAFTFSPDTSMPEGRFAVRAGWISVDGVPAAAANLGDIVIAVDAVVVDVVAPALVGAVIDPVAGDFDAVFSVAFALDGVVADDPVVVADINGERTAFVLDEEGSDRALGAFRYVFAPTLATAEGTWPVRASWTATDGEVVADVLLGSFTLDGTSPIAEVSLEPRLIGRTGRARLSVVCDSALAAPPVLEFDDDEDPGFRLVQTSDTVFVYELAVDCRSDGCLPRDGRYGVAAVNVSDDLGNARRVRLSDAAVVVDTAAPRVVGLTTNRARYSEVDGFNTLTVGFSVDEAVAAAGIAVSVDDLDLACDVVGRDVSCAGVIAPEAVAEGSPVVVVTVVDAAGNASVATRTLAVDYSAPALVDGSSTLTLTPASRDGVAHPGTRLAVALTASETLGGAPDVEAFPDDVAVDLPAANAFALANTSFLGGRVGVFEETLDAGTVDGGYRVRATLVDLVGHTTLVDVGVAFRFATVVESVCPTLGCSDGDGDGQLGSSSLCPEGPDCNDDDAAIFVGAPELPGDGKDNGCRGSGDAAVDESVGIFVDAVRGRDGAAGTRADPVNRVDTAVDVAFVAVGGGVDVGAASVVVGGFDGATWTQTGARSDLTNGFNLRGATHVHMALPIGANQRSLVVDCELNAGFAPIRNATVVDSTVSGGSVIDSAFADSTVSGVTFTGTSTLTRSHGENFRVGAFTGPPTFGVVLGSLTLTNSLITTSNGGTGFADIRLEAGSSLTAVNSEFATNLVVPISAPMVDFGDGAFTAVNVVVRPSLGRAFLRAGAAVPTLHNLVFVVSGVGFPPTVTETPGFPITDVGVAAFEAACATCSDLAVVSDTRSIDDVHVLPDSPLVGAGRDPSAFSPQAAVDVDGDCRVAPFDVGRDEVP